MGAECIFSKAPPSSHGSSNDTRDSTHKHHQDKTLTFLKFFRWKEVFERIRYRQPTFQNPTHGTLAMSQQDEEQVIGKIQAEAEEEGENQAALDELDRALVQTSATVVQPPIESSNPHAEDNTIEMTTEAGLLGDNNNQQAAKYTTTNNMNLKWKAKDQVHHLVPAQLCIHHILGPSSPCARPHHRSRSPRKIQNVPSPRINTRTRMYF